MARTLVTHADGHTVRATTVGELSPADFERWGQFDAQTLEGTPFLSADYLQPAVLHWPAARSIRLLVVERSDQIKMIMPFRIMPLHRQLPISTLSTWDLTLADETSSLFPMLATDGGIEALRAGFSALSSLGLPGLVDIVTIPADGPTYELIRRAIQPEARCHIRGRSLWPAARIPAENDTQPSAEVDTIPHHRSASTRKKAKQARRGLERELGAELATRDRSDDPNIVENFLDLQVAGWKGDPSKRGVAYRITGRAQWLHEVAERYRRRGQFAAFEIHAKGSPLYLSLDFRMGSTLVGFQDAYDEAWASYGLGNLARSAHLNWLAGREVDTYDPNMFWGYVDSARFYPDRRETLRLLVAASGRLPALQVNAVRAVKSFSSRLAATRDAARQSA